MRIAVVSRAVQTLHGVGGLERHVKSLVQSLVRAGADVTLYTAPPEPGSSPAGLEGARIRFVPYRMVPLPRRRGFVVMDRISNYVMWSVRVARRVLSDQIDIVSAEAGAGFGYALLRSVAAPPLIVQAHGMEEFKAPPLKRIGYTPLRLAVRYGARRASAVIAPDRAMVEEVSRFLRVQRERIAVLPMAVDLEEIDRPVSSETRGEILKRFGIRSDDTVLLSVGRLEANKGFAALAEALARGNERLVDRWLWILVGTGSEETSLRRRIGRLGLSDHSRLTGHLSDEALRVLYRRADLCVHPTLYEGSSLVTLEAMAHGRPVVATKVGGIPDKIVHGLTGFLVPPGNPEALVAAIGDALSSRARLHEMGRAARARVEAEFSWARRVRRLLELYQAVLASSGSGEANANPPRMPAREETRAPWGSQYGV